MKLIGFLKRKFFPYFLAKLISVQLSIAETKVTKH